MAQQSLQKHPHDEDAEYDSNIGIAYHLRGATKLEVKSFCRMEETAADKRVTTRLPPCCLCILREKFIIVGTYLLHKDSGNRTGSIEVYDKELNLLSSIKTYGAILDLKLNPFDDTLLATAHSTGNMILWTISVDDDNSLIDIKLLNNLQVFDPTCLITSLQFSPLLDNLVLLTTTNGDFATVDIIHGEICFIEEVEPSYFDSSTINYIEVPNADIKVINVQNDHEQIFHFKHSLECWTGEFGCLAPLKDVVFTGGDDSAIAAHDLNSGKKIWSNSKIHQAGVTAIKAARETFRGNKPTSLITGSYDDHIRSFDLRMLSETTIYPGTDVPVVNKWEDNLQGGVWRFSEAPTNDGLSNNRLMVCCMYNGAKVVNVQNDHFVTEQFIKEGHGSMCYGGDWSKETVATCSFYDKSLQLWKSPN